jgi:hypothetical protein
MWAEVPTDRARPAPETDGGQTLRTGPIVRRGANVTRTARVTPGTLRTTTFPRVFNNPPPSLPKPTVPDTSSVIESSCLHLECRLPINLRNFLAQQLGSSDNSDDESILNIAAQADEATLSKLARAIRRYSTNRAHEAWVECSARLDKFRWGSKSDQAGATLCLHCCRVDFGKNAPEDHRGTGCLALTLGGAAFAERNNGRADNGMTARLVQRQIEEFRALRVAFGLQHFDLDCYVRGAQITFTWRPLP